MRPRKDIAHNYVTWDCYAPNRVNGDARGIVMRNSTYAMRILISALIAGFVMLSGCELTSWPAMHAQVDEAPPTPTYTAWDASAYPNYYRVDGPATYVSTLSAGETTYGELDALGRATWAETVVDYDAMARGIARERGDMSSLEPTGWGHNAEVELQLPDGSSYHGYFWNRSHLLAKSLGGCDELCNLITGTRLQNVGNNDGSGGMAYCETRCRAWLEEHPKGTLSYRAVAAYEGDEPVPRSVIVDMRSSDGLIDERVEVFNAALGFSIDYATGEYVQETTAPVPDLQPTPIDDETPVVVSASGKAYHRDAGCSGLSNANEEALRTVSLEEAQRMGRHACGICYGDTESKN